MSKAIFNTNLIHPRLSLASFRNILFFCVGFEVLIAVVMKSSAFWDIMPYSQFKVNRRFGVTCRLSPKGRRISQARDQHEAGSKQTRSSETSVDFQRTARRYIPEDRTLQIICLHLFVP
jgi:hypothetical protein